MHRKLKADSYAPVGPDIFLSFSLPDAYYLFRRKGEMIDRLYSDDASTATSEIYM